MFSAKFISYVNWTQIEKYSVAKSKKKRPHTHFDRYQESPFFLCVLVYVRVYWFVYVCLCKHTKRNKSGACAKVEFGLRNICEIDTLQQKKNLPPDNKLVRVIFDLSNIPVAIGVNRKKSVTI